MRWGVLLILVIGWLPLSLPHGQAAGDGEAAVLRILDRMSGELREVTLRIGEKVTQGSITVLLRECRFPLENPASDAFADMQIVDAFRDEAVFEGWMTASSPALNGLDHSRYDVWVLRCANIS